MAGRRAADGRGDRGEQDTENSEGSFLSWGGAGMPGGLERTEGVTHAWSTYLPV
jgi:hypothetical protein